MKFFSKRIALAIAPFIAVLAVAITIIPMGASAKQFHGATRQSHGGNWRGGRTYGTTALAVDWSTLSLLVGAGIAPAPVAPAVVNPSTNQFQFPITNSYRNSQSTGLIDHSGGITLTKGSDVLKLTNFVINPGAKTLSADVNGGSTETPIADLVLTYATVTKRHGKVLTGPVGVLLNATAIGALNATFGTSLPTSPDVPLGTATVRQSTRSNWGWGW